MRTSDAARLLQALALLVLAVAAMVAALRAPVYGWDGKTRFHRVTGTLQAPHEGGWRPVPASRTVEAPEEAVERAARATYARHCERARLEDFSGMPGETLVEEFDRWRAAGGSECTALRTELERLHAEKRKSEIRRALADLGHPWGDP